jgi:hypothetical protein
VSVLLAASLNASQVQVVAREVIRRLDRAFCILRELAQECFLMMARKKRRRVVKVDGLVGRTWNSDARRELGGKSEGCCEATRSL